MGTQAPGVCPGKFSAAAPIALQKSRRMVPPSPSNNMKAFLEHDVNGLLYGPGDEWVRSPEHALAFATTAEAEHFRDEQHIPASHVVARLDPTLTHRTTS